MAEKTLYDNVTISRRAGTLLRREAKRTRRPIHVEAEILIEEAVKARENDAKAVSSKS